MQIISYRDVRDLLEYFLFSDVCPEDHTRAEDKVQRRGRLGIIDDGSHLVMVQRDLADIMTPREQQ